MGRDLWFCQIILGIWAHVGSIWGKLNYVELFLYMQNENEINWLKRNKIDYLTQTKDENQHDDDDDYLTTTTAIDSCRLNGSLLVRVWTRWANDDFRNARVCVAYVALFEWGLSSRARNSVSKLRYRFMQNCCMNGFSNSHLSSDKASKIDVNGISPVQSQL